jgi:hippurate hydrolase
MPSPSTFDALQPEMIRWRRDFHAHPELSLKETRTSSVVQGLLRSFGVDEVHTGLAGTGVVGVIRGGTPGGAIGLRADMDALPILEANEFSHASLTPGVMHGCGHDGHTVMLLGAASYLAQTRRFAGTAYVIFQPAEEDLDGGALMIRDGLFERFPMQRVFGMHNWPTRPVGTFFWRDGPMLAAAAMIDITIIGKGAHAAHPDQGIDPILVSAHVITALQSIVSRRLDAVDQGVVSICQIAAGQAHNVIPDRVQLGGTARWFLPEVGKTIEQAVRRLTQEIASAFGARAEVNFTGSCPATVNEPESMQLARDAAEAVVGKEAVHHLDRPSLGTEDFAFMLERKAGSYIILGAGRTGDDPALHNARYDFNDDILPIGAAYWATLAEQVLAR